MAPEYVEEQKVSPAVDVYQMGLVLVELLAGRGVIEESNPWKCALMHVSRELTVPAELLDSVLGPVIEKSLSLRPEDRYADATAFADALALVDVSLVQRVALGAPVRRLDQTSSEVLAPTLTTQELQKRQSPRKRAKAMTGRTREMHGDSEEGQTAPIEGAGSRQMGLMIALVIVAILSVAAIIVVVSLKAPEGSGDEMLVEVDVEIPEIDPELALVGEADEELEVEHDEELEPEPEPEPIFVEVRTVPAEAQVSVGGEVLGRGLVDFEFAGVDAEPVEAEVSASGFLPRTVTIGPSTDPRTIIELERRRTTRQPTQQQRPPRDPEPAPRDDGMRLAP
jgi:hypothetical protein